MSIIKVKTKGQVTLPTEVRKRMKLSIGDVLRVDIKANQITLTPQSLIDRELAESIKEHKAGKSYGPFNSADEMITFLDRQTKKRYKK